MSYLIQGFGHSVRSLLESQGWSQEYLAEKADLNRSYLGEVERGQVTPSLSTAEKIALALGVNLSDLIASSEGLFVELLAEVLFDGDSLLNG
jgi:transcriptional regulator with XRE-family HTH domain